MIKTPLPQTLDYQNVVSDEERLHLGCFGGCGISVQIWGTMQESVNQGETTHTGESPPPPHTHTQFSSGKYVLLFIPSVPLEKVPSFLSGSYVLCSGEYGIVLFQFFSIC